MVDTIGYTEAVEWAASELIRNPGIRIEWMADALGTIYRCDAREDLENACHRALRQVGRSLGLPKIHTLWP
jgi:hypothetical protein